MEGGREERRDGVRDLGTEGQSEEGWVGRREV